MEQNKLSPHQYGLCVQCKHEPEYGSDRCIECTSFAGTGPSMFLCGIPIGTSGYYLHKNFEKLAAADPQEVNHE